VDFGGGADGNSGTAAGAPFQRCPGDQAATGVAAATVLAPGDTVIFKGGVTYLGFITCTSNGVTYDGNSAGTFGAGRAIFDGQNSTTQLMGFTATDRSGLVFDNLEMELYGGHGLIPWTGLETRGFYGYAIYLDGCSQVAVRNCYFHDIGDWQSLPNANEGYMEGVGIGVIDSGNAITITANEFTEIGRGAVMIQPKQGTQICTNIAITGNNFHDFIRWGVWLATGNTNCTLDGVTIDGNQFHDMYQYGTGEWLGLAGDAPHIDCIIAYIGCVPPEGGQTLGTVASPIIIRNNLFYNNATATGVQNSAVFLTTWGGRTLIYNNLFINVLFDGNGAVFCFEGTDTSINPPPDYWIFNNSFYETTYGVTLESELYPLTNGAVHILNNIFYKPDSSAAFSVRIVDSESTPTRLDYNLYFTGRPDNQLAFTPAGCLTLTQLQAQGYELHGQQADPLFVNVSFGLGPSSSSNDLHLQAGSPATGAGFNLSAFYNADKDGVLRPVPPANWDTGAYQFAGAPLGPPGAPTGVSAAAGDGQATVTFTPPNYSAGVLITRYTITATPGTGSSVTVVGTASPITVTGLTNGTAYTITVSAINSAGAGASSSPLTAIVPGVGYPRMTNISIRAFSSVGSNTLIAGFAINGGSKQILVRGIGPGLAPLGVTGFLTNPEISLYSPDGTVQSNDAWGGTVALTNAFIQTGAFALDPASLDAAMLATLDAGSYTTVVTSGDGSGVALAEVYDADAASSPAGSLSNLSGRAWVGTGSNILIAGFVIAGSGPETVLIRGVGPSLAQFGIGGGLAEPQIQLFQNSTLLEQNSGWNDDSVLSAAFAQVGAFTLTSPLDAAMIVTLQPGEYSVHVSGGDGTTGVALVEVYQL